jgi:FKBP12-rapamycin complex-associated protein
MWSTLLAPTIKHQTLDRKSCRVLHSLYTEATSTSDEMFLLECRDDIEAAERHLDEWEETGADEDLTQAWESYLCVFRVAHRIKESLKSVDLSLCSPMLLECRDLELAMPGQYRPGHPIVGIRSVSQHMPIISSKQKPRKCTMEGSDGRVYSYLLKGHEDLRQVSREISIFSLSFSLSFSLFLSH